jgi:putative membrane protein
VNNLQIDPYCGSAPAPEDLLLRWNTDPVLLCALGGLALVLWRYRRSGSGARDAILLLVLLVTAFVSPLCALSSALFSARALHHVILISLAAPLAALLLPQENRLLDRIPSWASFLGHTAILWAWHLPGPYAFALSGSAAYWILEAPLLVTAVLLWHDILHPRRIGAGLGVCAGTLLQMSLLGAILTFASAPMFEAHFLTTEAYGLSALEDQQLAGLLMWVPASLIYVAAFLLRIRDLMAQSSLGGALGGSGVASGVR